jgi:hypothetical protein
VNNLVAQYLSLRFSKNRAKDALRVCGKPTVGAIEKAAVWLLRVDAKLAFVFVGPSPVTPLDPLLLVSETM